MLFLEHYTRCSIFGNHREPCIHNHTGQFCIANLPNRMFLGDEKKLTQAQVEHANFQKDEPELRN